VLFAPPAPIVDVHPTVELRTASPVNEVSVDHGTAATLVGETPSWEYILVWSPKGVVVRPTLACDLQESNIVLAGERLAHICNENGENTVLTATFNHAASVPRLHSSAFVTLAGQGTLVAGSAGSTLYRFDATKKVKLGTYPGSALVLNVDGDRILVGRTNTVLALVSRTGKPIATLRIPHVGGALLRGSRIASIAGHKLVVSDLHGRALRSRPVIGDATLMDASAELVVYSVGIRLHLLRLSDGRDVTLRFKRQFGYASAKLWRGGLFYAYNVGGGGSKPGRAGFVAAAGVQALLRG
jgi:hypothetical protein